MARYEFNPTPERSRTMSRIRSTGGKTEVMLAKALWHRGIRYRRNYRKIIGTPDIAITKYKVAVFIDGEFWHGYDWEKRKQTIKSNRDYWLPKIERNMMRDLEVNEALRSSGWFVVRFWEKEIKKDMEHCLNKIQDAIFYQRELLPLLKAGLNEDQEELDDFYWEDFDCVH